MTDVITIPMLRQHNRKGKTCVLLLEDIKQGQLRDELKQSLYKERFTEFSSKGGVSLRDTRLLIHPDILR